MDVATFFESSLLSDIDLVIKETAADGVIPADAAAPQPAQGSQEVWRGPGHRLVIFQGSEVLAAQMQRWSADPTTDRRPLLEIAVDPGQGTAAKRLLQTIYAGKQKDI